jgi:hypothetical protein
MNTDTRTEWIEIDLADLDLAAPLVTPDEVATATAHVYERFVPFADQGWQWVVHPGSSDFEGWLYQLRDGELKIVSARLLSRKLEAEPTAAARPAHGVSSYRTRQLTGRPWTAVPGSKLWKAFGSA